MAGRRTAASSTHGGLAKKRPAARADRDGDLVMGATASRVKGGGIAKKTRDSKDKDTSSRSTRDAHASERVRANIQRHLTTPDHTSRDSHRMSGIHSAYPP